MIQRAPFLLIVLTLTSCGRDSQNPAGTETPASGRSHASERAATRDNSPTTYDARSVAYETVAMDESSASPDQLATFIERARTSEAHGELARSLQDWQLVRDLVEHRFGAENWQSTNARLASENVEWRMRLDQQQQTLLHKIQRLEAAARDPSQSLAAVNMWRQARLLAEQLWGSDALATAVYLEYEAAAEHDAGQLSTAAELYGTALRIRERTLGQEHPDYCSTLDALAQVHFDGGGYDIARQYLEEATQLNRSIWGGDHHRYAAHLNQLGIVHHRMRDTTQAELVLRDAFQILERHPEDVRSLLADTAYNLGAVYFAQDDLQRAIEQYQFALASYEADVGRADRRSLRVMESLAAAYFAQEDHRAAEIFLQEVAVIRARDFGEQHPDTVRTLFRLAVALGNQGKYNAAEPILQKVLQTQQSEPSTDPSQLRKTIEMYAALLRKTGRPEDADALVSWARSVE